MSSRLQFSPTREEEDSLKKDSFSYLSDEVLYVILSFLSMKDAAITSLLSWRWRCLFYSQRILNFDDHSFPDHSIFLKFFYSFFAERARGKDPPIVSFNLKFHHHTYDKNDIPNLVSTALQGVIQNLCIDLCHPDCSIMKLSSFYIRTKTLLVLILKRITIDQAPYFDLPSLKALHMESVTFSDYKYLTKILSGCPVMEELETKDLMVEKNYRVSMGEAIYFSNLVRANISGEHILYAQLRNAHHLHLHATWPYKLDSMFHNLNHLEITLDFDPKLAGKLKWSWLKNLLPNFPKLQTLIIHEADTTNNFGDGNWVEPNIVPDCLLYHLTTCLLVNYSRINCELQFAKYILQNSRVLSTMTIQFAKSVETNTTLQMVTEISFCQKHSATCQLLFI